MAFQGSTRASERRASRSGALFLWRGLLLAIAVGYSLSGTAHATTGQWVKIAKVIDGDTVILTDKRHIRLIGINTPETGRRDRPAQPLANEAKSRLQNLLEKGQPRLIPGQQHQDRHGRILGYLHVESASGKIDVQNQLLQEGLAWLVAIPPNISQLDSYQQSQTLAKNHKRGIWAEPAYQAKSVNKLTAADSGFQRVSGQIKRIGRSQKYVYFNFNRRFSVRISHQNWRTYFQHSATSYANKTVTVSGWVGRQGKNKLGMKIGHPAMIEIDNSQ